MLHMTLTPETMFGSHCTLGFDHPGPIISVRFNHNESQSSTITLCEDCLIDLKELAEEYLNKAHS